VEGINSMNPVIIGKATLYNADCRDIDLNADVFVSDPPYGIGFKYEGEYKDAGGAEYENLLKVFEGKKSVLLQYPEETMRYFLPLFGVPDDCIAWCYNSNTNRQFRLWSFFGIKPDFNAYKVKAKNPTDKRVADLVRSYDWFDDIQQVKNVSEEKTAHPCQISVSQMERIVLLTKASSVCDPFMGSGSTGVACVNHGKQFIGVERNAEYFDIACQRIEAAYSQERLFA
jgi:DNA modification methylase